MPELSETPSEKSYFWLRREDEEPILDTRSSYGDGLLGDSGSKASGIPSFTPDTIKPGVSKDPIFDDDEDGEGNSVEFIIDASKRAEHNAKLIRILRSHLQGEISTRCWESDQQCYTRFSEDIQNLPTGTSIDEYITLLQDVRIECGFEHSFNLGDDEQLQRRLDAIHAWTDLQSADYVLPRYSSSTLQGFLSLHSVQNDKMPSMEEVLAEKTRLAERGDSSYGRWAGSFFEKLRGKQSLTNDDKASLKQFAYWNRGYRPGNSMGLSEAQHRGRKAFCDTFVPKISISSGSSHTANSTGDSVVPRLPAPPRALDGSNLIQL
ncbi:hypothetical protein I203_100017 [Kwoniella mangroviensis CBS 8507]|uniref:uncharacterized protein n=1 Tax=Kwoniella mangroviensis CBS 8507 TaxID=1296122 RepID=UPI00080D7875|nr:uncharacterized protein I203_08251 [Kwoniella mangroviensis CBS 8507]OCF62676.1 hypothetical protein I203_08251 [Kwoniella mangroviensis CBS 8507]